MTLLATITDGLQNLVANIGTGRDKAAASTHVFTPMTAQELVTAFRASFLAAKIVDMPADDAFREWREWQADAGQISAIEAEEKRLNVIGNMRKAMKSARLHGGAAIYIATADLDLTEPLDPDNIGKDGIKYLAVLKREQLTEGVIEKDPRKEGFGMPSLYTINTGTSETLDIHPSRLVILIGKENHDETAGWGDSVLDSVMEAILRLDSTAANIGSLVFEAKVDVVRIKGLMKNLAEKGSKYEGQLLKRFNLAALAKGINGMLVMDMDEEYAQKSASFATLPDVLDRFMQLVSAAASMPMTKLFGTSPGGLNSTGESDTRSYYDLVRVTQTLDISPAMAVLDECLIRSALGNRPVEVHYNWAPLWQPSAKEKADVGKTLADTIKIATDAELIPQDAASDALVNALTESGAFPGLETTMKEVQGGEGDWEEGTAET